MSYVVVEGRTLVTLSDYDRTIMWEDIGVISRNHMAHSRLAYYCPECRLVSGISVVLCYKLCQGMMMIRAMEAFDRGLGRILQTRLQMQMHEIQKKSNQKEKAHICFWSGQATAFEEPARMRRPQASLVSCREDFWENWVFTTAPLLPCPSESTQRRGSQCAWACF
jgi:hypothetical protein